MENTGFGILDGNTILTEVATELIKDAVSSGWEKTKKFFKDIDAKDSITYGTAYTNYLINTKEKYGKIKTLIYRRVPKELYSFYECIGVNYNGTIVDTSSVQNLLEIGNKLIITGTGGIGKSTLLKHLFLNVISTTDFIPVLIELRRFNSSDVKEISLYDAIYNTLCENGFNLKKEYFEISLKEGGYVIFLDGFDEINRDKVDCITSEIKSFSDKYKENNYIISSRPTDGFIGWNDFSEMTSLPLTKEQALSLVNKIDFDESVKKIFYQALDENLYKKYKSFASNPLLLTIMLLTFNNHASIPEKLNDFYEEAFSTLFNMHDATKDCYVRDIRTNLGCEEFKLIFSYICFKSYFTGELEFSESRLREYIQKAKVKFPMLQFSVDNFIEDLTLSVCMFVKDGLCYRFSHRTFQEYFAAWYTCKITDELQYKLLTSWLGESNAVATDEYLDMLFDLQPEKVNKVIFCPGIKKFKQLYDTDGFSYNLLSKLFSGISLKHRTVDNKESWSIALTIKNYYFCNVLKMTCKLNKYVYSKNPDADEHTLAVKVQSTDSQHARQWDFDEVLQIVSQEDLVNSLSWFNRQCQFCFNILMQNTDNSLSRKKKLSSIIDEL